MALDFSKLRDQTLDSGLDEEAVTVNTRALIDKVLARYSGEWTTLRELIQNASDSGARNVTVRFDTLPSPTVPVPPSSEPSVLLKHTLQNHTLRRLLVSNDGAPFNENDWQRLKRIAEGNPDETKIGAFGVGYYSVFADCENPFVTSGTQTMAFYWKTNTLYTRRGRLPRDTPSSDTCILLDYRDTSSPVPNILSLCQFLSTSLTFVGLQSVDLWLDQFHLLHLAKKSAPSANLSIPVDVNTKTKDGLMKITAVDHHHAQIDASWMNAIGWTRTTDSRATAKEPETGPSSQSLRTFFSRFTSSSSSSSFAAKKAAKEEETTQRSIEQNMCAHSSASVFLRVSTVNVQTLISKSLAAELERATKKPPPKTTRIAILTSPWDETSAASSTLAGLASSKATDLFASVLPSKNGRIFIGFPTAQTTGLLAHISAPSVIPTVERESIDLNARHVRSWNTEMLRVAGIACRIAYTGQMAELKARLARQTSSSGTKAPSLDHVASVVPAAVHTLNQYTYHESTPSSQVGQIIEEAFWMCNQKPSIDILSSRGVLPSANVRLATEDLSFVQGIPVIPDELVAKASTFLQKIKEFGLLSEITTKDIKKELEAQALNENQLSEFLKWAAKKMERSQLDGPAVRNLFDGTVITLAEEHAASYPGPVLLLGSIDVYPNPSRIPAELPMPPTAIPFRFVKTIQKSQLEAFGWGELQIVPWVRYLLGQDGSTLTGERSLTQSVNFAAQIHPVMSKVWDTLSSNSKSTVIELFRDRTIIPTKFGMKRPSQAYFASVRLFDDLPTVHGLQSVKEKYLAAIGVRKTVELSVVFARLMAAKSEPESAADNSMDKGTVKSQWSHMDLIKYLVSVRDDIPAEDIKKLRETPICPAERSSGANGAKLYRLSELYEPRVPLRELGLRLLYWSEPLRPDSQEAKFLSSLGLLAYPTVDVLVDIMASAAAKGDTVMHETAVHYLIANGFHNGYNKISLGACLKKFLPVAGADLSPAVAPRECFTNGQCAVLGFNILRDDLQAHASLLGVALDPPIATCVERLIRQPPLTRVDAKKLFGYFAGRMNELGSNSSLAASLGDAPIVPIIKSMHKDSSPRFVSARNCFLGDSQTYGEIFDFVDFGSDANSFLLKIGSKHEPTAFELAGMLIREPGRLLNTLGSDKYLSLLRRLADNQQGLKSDKQLWKNLKSAPCLLACREVVAIKDPEATAENDLIEVDDDEESAVKEYSLASAGQMVLADDFSSYRLFKARLITGPQEELLETFYSALGTPWLSTLIDEEQRSGPELPDQSMAQQLRKLIIERSRLFLHDHGADAVRHDARWLEKALAVKAVTTLTNRRTLRGYNASHLEKRSAAMHRESKFDAVLYTTAKADLFEVSRALMSLLLKRPKQQDYMALEMIMDSDLRRLKIKGYNVDRILRQKAAESRIAETERQRQLAEEQAKMAEQQQAWQATQAAQAQESNTDKDKGTLSDQLAQDRKPIPGAFEASPEQLRSQIADMVPESVKKSGLFSKISKQLGMQPSGSRPPRDMLPPNMGTPNMGPPNVGSPNVDQKQKRITGDDTKTNDDGAVVSSPKEKAKGPEVVSSPHDLSRNLMSAVQSSRAHNADGVFNPPKTNTIKEEKSYCDNIPDNNLRFVAATKAGLKVFVEADLSAEDASTFLGKNVGALNTFAPLLVEIGEVFLLQPASMHIFYNEGGPSIAFNTNGSLFFNIRFFLQLHWAAWLGESQSASARVDAAVYWWVTMCHELAHNLVSEHSSAHEFYTESFVSQYFSKFTAKAMVWQAAAGRPAGRNKDVILV